MKSLFIFLIFLAVSGIIACQQKPWVKHKITLTKKGEDCARVAPDFKLTSNTNGDRYEFEECLPGDFTKENVTSSLHGDTVVISFNKTAAAAPAVVFGVVLDVDSNPRYNFITIGDETYPITHSN